MPVLAARPQNANYKCRQEQDRIEFGPQKQQQIRAATTTRTTS